MNWRKRKKLEHWHEEEYIEGYRRAIRHHIEGIKLVDEDGNDVTPEKLRQVQREKGLHGRSLDNPNS